MPLSDIVGIDHAVVAVSDLDRAERAWSELGFTLSPRGTHSATMGTGNATIMLADDYIELFAVLTPTELNRSTRHFLETREGIERVAFTSLDAEAGVQALRQRGLNAVGPIDFARPVERSSGGISEARFSTYQWPADAAPADLRLFACQHWTRDAVWLPELQQHANTAHRIVAVLVVSPQPERDSDELARLIDRNVATMNDGQYTVPSGNSRADFIVQTCDQLMLRYPQIKPDDLPQRGVAGLVIGVADLDAAARTLGAAASAGASYLYVSADAATGVHLVFAGELRC